MGFPKFSRAGYPLLGHLLLVQLTAILCGFALLYGSYRWISEASVHSAITSLKKDVKPGLERVQEDLRAWKLFGMEDTLATNVATLKSRFPISDLRIVSRGEVPLQLNENQLAIPETSDGPIDSLVLVTLDTKDIIARYRVNEITYYFLLGISILFALVVLYSLRYIQTHIYTPIASLNRAFVALKAGEPLDIKKIKSIGEIREFIFAFHDMYERTKKMERQAALHEISRQVAHDIRSPLAALEMIEPFLQELPEEKRVILRGVTVRVRDIANTLLEKSRGAAREETSSLLTPETPRVTLFSSIVDSMMTEKREQYRARRNLELRLVLDPSSYGLFANVQQSELKRVVSNLINNAVEAIESAGNVTVGVSAKGRAICLTISDTGKGIPPEVLPRILELGESFGKIGGSGLGLSHARKTVAQWGGDLKIESRLSRGTTVTVLLPQAEPPRWFVRSLCAHVGDNVVVLDDDTLIHQVWTERFAQSATLGKGVKLIHFSSEEELLAWRANAPAEGNLFLFDYELGRKKKNGLDIIEELALGNRAVLVTSRYEEDALIQRCDRLHVRLLPKNLAGIVPIETN